MANLAYQVTGFAYQGDGQFAYQGSSGGPTPTVIYEGARRRRQEQIEREDREIALILELIMPVIEAGETKTIKVKS